MKNTNRTQDIEVIKVPKDKILFNQGDVGDAAYVVTSGAVALYRNVNGQTIPLATVREGGSFGEMAVLDGSPRLATAKVIESSTLTVISGSSVLEKVKKADPLLQILLRMLMSNLRSVHKMYMPRPRTLNDVASLLVSQSDVLKGLLENKAHGKFKTSLQSELDEIRARINMIRVLARDIEDVDPRANAIPGEKDVTSV